MKSLVSKKKSHHEEEKIQIITNWAETSTIFPLKKEDNSLVNELNLLNKFIVLYAGNMGRTHDVESIAYTAQKFSVQGNDRIHFLFVGSGSKVKWLQSFVSDQKLSNVNILPYRPNSEKNITLTACDVAIIAFAPGMTGVSVPSRMYNQFASGRPMIAMTDEFSELAQVVKENQLGWVIPQGDVSSLQEVIELASVKPELCREMGYNATKVAQTRYSQANVLLEYSNLFQELLQ